MTSRTRTLSALLGLTLGACLLPTAQAQVAKRKVVAAAVIGVGKP